MLLLAAFLLVPMIEIALFIAVGGWIGLWPTLALVILSAVLGTSIMRSQGAHAMRRLQTSFEDLRDPTEPLAHGAMILIAGVMLVVPGFFTDTVGLLLLIPQVREAVYAYAARRIEMREVQYGASHASYQRRSPDGGEVIDGEFEDVTPERRRSPSGWVDAPRDRD
jgi:UPF0716 protein FxsA